MKKLCALLLILSLLLPGAAGTAEEPRLEGDGYATPEEAVLAYLDAMNREDVDAMLSTFAMESLVSHVNDRQYRLRYGNVFPDSLYNAPLTDEYSRSVLLLARYGTLAKRLMMQYIDYNGGSNNPYGGTRIVFQDAEEMAEYEESFLSSPMQDMAGHVEFVAWISPALLNKGWFLEAANRQTFALQTAYYCADDVTDVIAHIRINGVDGLQFMQCVKYGDRWYNAEFGGITASLMAIDQSQQTLTLAHGEQEARELQAMLQPDGYAEACAQWDALRDSSLAGTRWRLTQVSDPGITVMEDGAQTESDEGLSLSGELRFYSFGGGVMNWQASAALQEKLGMDWSEECASFAWQEAGDPMEIQKMHMMSGQHADLDLTVESVSLERKAWMIFASQSLTLRFSDGTTATFEKQ